MRWLWLFAPVTAGGSGEAISLPVPLLMYGGKCIGHALLQFGSTRHNTVGAPRSASSGCRRLAAARSFIGLGLGYLGRYWLYWLWRFTSVLSYRLAPALSSAGVGNVRRSLTAWATSGFLDFQLCPVATGQSLQPGGPYGSSSVAPLLYLASTTSARQAVAAESARVFRCAHS